MIVIYSKILNAYLCFKTSKTYGTRSLLSCKCSRTEAISAGMARLPFKRV